FWASKVYRDAYELFISCGILYNHESERRPANFVTGKIVRGIGEYLHTGKSFTLGNLQAKKDWGYAPEYVEGMWRMLQADKPDDFVLATNERHTVQEFLEAALDEAGIDYSVLEVEQLGEQRAVYLDDKGKAICSTNQKLLRPLEADNYQGDASKAKRVLGWEAKTKMSGLVRKMMRAYI
ncbi:MAG: GDP-mannose 4,6-dehydratase, partial [Candidatus Parvarchaeum sp.]